MIELSNEFKMFLGRGMYEECSKIVLIKIKQLLLAKINEKNRSFYSDDFSCVIEEYLKQYSSSNNMIQEILNLEEEVKGDDQVERLSKLLEIQTMLEES